MSTMGVIVKGRTDTRVMQVLASSTVQEFKTAVSNEFSVPAEQLCLIYTGEILGDNDTIHSCGIKDTSIIHLVIKTSSQMSSVPEASTVERGDVPVLTLDLLEEMSVVTENFFGMMDAELISQMEEHFRQENPSCSNMVQLLFPEILRNLPNHAGMRSQVQHLLSNTNVVRQILSNFPMTKELVERNPELLDSLDDPEYMQMMNTMLENPSWQLSVAETEGLLPFAMGDVQTMRQVMDMLGVMSLLEEDSTQGCPQEPNTSLESDTDDTKLTKGAFLDRRSPTRLHGAIKQNDLELLRHLLDHSQSDFGIPDVNGRSPLVTAMLDGAWKPVSVMLDYQTIDIVAISSTNVVIDNNGWTVYHKLSSEYKDDFVYLSVVQELVIRDPNFNIVNFNGDTPLHTAAEYNNVVNVLCTDDNINAQNYTGLTPLHVAVRKGNMAAVRTLLECGANVQLADELFNTPLHFIRPSNYTALRSIFPKVNVAKTCNVLGALSQLLWLSPDGDVDVDYLNYRDYCGNSVLHFIATEGSKVLLDKNLFLSDKFCAKCYTERNAYGQSPIHVLIPGSGVMPNVDISVLLSDERVKMSLTTSDGRGRNILHHVFLSFNLKFLSQYIIDIYIRQSHVGDVTASSELKCKGRWCIYSRLNADLERLTQGGKVDDVVGCCSRDSLGRTPIHYAAMSDGKSVSNVCIQCGNCGCWCTCFLYFFGVDCLLVQDAFGRTPIHYTAWSKNRNKPTGSVCRDLSAAGFNIDNIYKVTPQWISNDVTRKLICDGENYFEFGRTFVSFACGEMNLGELWLKFAGCKIDPWLVWQEESESGLYSPDRRQLTEAVNNAVTSFMQRLIDAIGHEDARFHGRLLAVGSAFEQTKLDLPNEFDFSIVLTKFSDICQVCQPAKCPPGFRVLKKMSNIDLSTEKYAPYAYFFNDDNTLQTPAVNFWFRRAFAKVLSGQTFWESEPLFQLHNLTDFCEIYPSKLAKTLKLTVSGPILDTLIDFVICVDMVPVIHFPNWWPEDGIQVDDDIRSDGCFFVFDPPHSKYRVPFSSDTPYVKIAFARAGSLSLRLRPAVVRAAYLVAKRICCRIYNPDLLTIEDVKTTIASVDHIKLSSHVLKMAALSLTYAIGDDDDRSVVSKAALITQVENLFEKLYEFAVRDRAVSSFMPSFSFRLWKYEKFVEFSHTFLREHSMNYETLFNSNAEVQKNKCELTKVYDKIRQSLVLVYALYAAVSCREPDRGVEWTYPTV